MLLWRGLTIDTASRTLFKYLDPTGEYIDTEVTLGTEYCYWMQGVVAIAGDGDLESNILGPKCTTPLAEPLCEVDLAVNDHAASTDSADVVLTVATHGAATQMCVSHTPVYDNWVPYSETMDWTLDISSGAGPKKVYMAAHGADGRLFRDSATINLVDEGGPCDPDPCKNGGTCEDQGGGLYKCSCPAGFAGDNCESTINPNMKCVDECTAALNGQCVETCAEKEEFDCRADLCSGVDGCACQYPADKVKCADNWILAILQLALGWLGWLFGFSFCVW